MKIVNCKLNYSGVRGQVAIVVLLISAVMLTLGLSMSKSETVEIKINANDELLKKAFDTAESGINFYLGTGGTNYSSPGNNSVADINVSKIGVGNSINFDEFVPAGSSESYWLVNHLDNGDIGTTYYAGVSVNVCNVGFTGSMEISYFYKNGANYNVARSGFNFGSKKVSGFTDTPPGCVNILTDNSPILLVVTPIINGGKFYIEATGGNIFSSQGENIVSEGKISTQASKKLSIRRRYKLPGFMVSGMMAEGKILSD